MAINAIHGTNSKFDRFDSSYLGQNTDDNATDEIGSIKWRVDNTAQEGLIFDGLPMLAPWVDGIKNATRETRRRIGQQLKDARMAQNISVRSLAIQSGVDKSSICRIEAGRLNTGIDTLTRLADILGLRLILVDA